jgi:allantoinase
MSTYDLCIANARVVDEHGEFYGAIGIHDGKIAALLAGPPDAPAAETIDAGGRVLLPGLVDAHVHFNEPGRTDWEGFECGGRRRHHRDG